LKKNKSSKEHLLIHHDIITMILNLFLALLSFSVISYINGFTAVNMPNSIADLPPLPDIGFQYLPLIPEIYPNILLIIFCVYFFGRFIRLQNIEILTKLIWCIAILFAFRIFTFTVTTVPPSTIGCANRNSSAPFEWNAVKFLISQDDNTCTDYMFSGHAVYFILLYLFMFKLSGNVIEKIVFFIYVVLGIMSIIAGHIHYTVDVVIAIILSFGCYYFVTKPADIVQTLPHFTKKIKKTE